MRPKLCCIAGGPPSLGPPAEPGGPPPPLPTCPAGTNPLLPNAAPEGAPVARPGRPHVVDEDGGGVDPEPLADARLDSLPVRRRGADDDAVIGGEALVPG
jgi:hypothetical protein